MIAAIPRPYLLVVALLSLVWSACPKKTPPPSPDITPAPKAADPDEELSAIEARVKPPGNGTDGSIPALDVAKLALKQKTDDTSPVVATVQGRLIRQSDLDLGLRRFREYSPGASPAREPTRERKLEVIDRLVSEEAALLEAIRRELHKSETVIQRYQERLSRMATQTMLEGYLSTDVKVTEAEVNEQLRMLQERQQTLQQRHPQRKPADPAKLAERARQMAVGLKKRTLRDRFIARIMHSAKLEHRDEGLERVRQAWIETRNRIQKERPKFHYVRNVDEFNLGEKDKTMVAAVFDRKHGITVRDVLGKLMDIVPPKRPALDTLESVRAFVDKNASGFVVAARAFREGWYRDSKLQELLGQRLRSMLIYELKQQTVHKKLQELQEQQQKKKRKTRADAAIARKKRERLMDVWRRKLLRGYKVEIKI